MGKGGSELEMMLLTDEVSPHHSHVPPRACWSSAGFGSGLLLRLIGGGGSWDVQMVCGPCQDARLYE